MNNMKKILILSVIFLCLASTAQAYFLSDIKNLFNNKSQIFYQGFGGGFKDRLNAICSPTVIL